MNVPFPRKPPDLLMAESPPTGGLSALSGTLTAMSEIEDRLQRLGLALPAPPAAPPGARLPFAFVRVHGELAYVSGHGPLDGDRVLATGRVPTEVSVEQAYEAARATGLSMLASLQREVGDLDQRAAVRHAGSRSRRIVALMRA